MIDSDIFKAFDINSGERYYYNQGDISVPSRELQIDISSLNASINYTCHASHHHVIYQSWPLFIFNKNIGFHYKINE